MLVYYKSEWKKVKMRNRKRGGYHLAGEKKLTMYMSGMERFSQHPRIPHGIIGFLPQTKKLLVCAKYLNRIIR